jgi:hypothetical protein
MLKRIEIELNVAIFGSLLEPTIFKQVNTDDLSMMLLSQKRYEGLPK